MRQHLFAITFFTSLFTMPLNAQEFSKNSAEICLNNDPNCVPLFACIESTGESFVGGTMGDEEGPIAIKSNFGALCYGRWHRNFLGLGQAHVTCQDNRTVKSLFTWFEKDTGTAVGQGIFHDGTIAKFWSGNNLSTYFQQTGQSAQILQSCDPAALLG